MFYKPIKLTHPQTGVPLFVYMQEGVEALIPRNEPALLDKYLQELYQANNEAISRGNVQILIIWALEDSLMTDAWLFSFAEEWFTAASVDVVNFTGVELTVTNGVTTGDGLIMLASEEILRQSVQNIEEYTVAERDAADTRVFNGLDYFES